jgi:hypothetical protein
MATSSAMCAGQIARHVSKVAGWLRLFTINRLEMKIYKNSALLMREKIHSIIEDRLKIKGRISVGIVYGKIQHLCSYQVAQRHFKDIMNEMVNKGLAIRTIRNGVYVIINGNGVPVEKVQLNLKQCSREVVMRTCGDDNTGRYIYDEPEEIKEPLVRPPAVYSNTSREQTIEKYLRMSI